MKLAAALVTLAISVSGCNYGYVPVRPTRTVCSGSVVASGSYATGLSTCRTYPPDRCAADSPTLREDEASGYCNAVREQNDSAHSRERRDWIIAGVVLGVAIVAAGFVAAAQ